MRKECIGFRREAPVRADRADLPGIKTMCFKKNPVSVRCTYQLTYVEAGVEPCEKLKS